MIASFHIDVPAFTECAAVGYLAATRGPWTLHGVEGSEPLKVDEPGLALDIWRQGRELGISIKISGVYDLPARPAARA